jgi:hypothetical protein
MNTLALNSDNRLSLQRNGISLHDGIVARGLIHRLAGAADEYYQKISAIPAETIRDHLPAGQKHIPTASSFTLEAIFSVEECDEILHAIINSTAGDAMEHILGGLAACDLDQAWVRRQYAPARYPRFHAPHGWHQDGALGCDFSKTDPDASEANNLLPMLTCWIPLVPCGYDAPGLEFVATSPNVVLPPSALTETSVRSTFPQEHLVKPVMKPGDVVLFQSNVLHRTYVTPGMQSDRTSIELRFVAADRIPPRLAPDRFVYCELSGTAVFSRFSSGEVLASIVNSQPGQ